MRLTFIPQFFDSIDRTGCHANGDTLVSTIQITAQEYRPPAACIEMPDQVSLGQSVTLRSCSDVLALPAHYVWKFGDDGSRPEGNEVQHTFSSVGQIEVKLSIVDNQGNAAETARMIEVLPPPPHNRPPVAILTVSPNPAQVGASVTFDASASNDPDGDPLAYAWEFPDRSFAGGAIVTRSFDDPASRAVQVTVTDREGLASKSQAVVEIEPTPPARNPWWLYLAALTVVAAIAASPRIFTSLADVTSELAPAAIEIEPDRDLCREFVNCEIEIENYSFQIQPKTGVIGSIERVS